MGSEMCIRDRGSKVHYSSSTFVSTRVRHRKQADTSKSSVAESHHVFIQVFYASFFPLCCSLNNAFIKPPTISKIFRLFRYAYPSSSLRCSRKRPSLCLSRVPPAVCPSLLESATAVCTSFLQSLFTYVHTPTPHSILRFRPAPQTPDLHTSNLPLFASTADTQPCEGPPSRLYHF